MNTIANITQSDNVEVKKKRDQKVKKYCYLNYKIC